MKELQNAVDVEYGLQSHILGTGPTNTADALLLGVLNNAAGNEIPANEIGTAYQQALIKDQLITTGVGVLSLLAAAGITVGPEVYAYCLANPAACTALFTEALDCGATVACTSSAGMLSAGMAETISRQLETNTIGWTGKIGEDYLATLGGEGHAFFPTTDGPRYVDRLVGGVAHESKVGYTSLTSGIARQIAKDVELLSTD